MSRKALIGIAVVILVGIAIWLSKEGELPGIYKTYKDPEGAFTFQYPTDFKVTGREKSNAVLARVTTPKDYLPKTNFVDGELVFGWTNDQDEIQQCLGQYTLEDVGAGHFRRTTLYKKVYDGDCYTFAYTIHSLNIENLDPRMEISEFNEEEVRQVFEKIVKSFKFLFNSD